MGSQGLKMGFFPSRAVNLAAAALLFIALALRPTLALAEQHVLVLNSYHQGMDWTDGQIAGVRAAIAEPDAVQFHIEYMDTKRLTDAAHLENLYRLFAHKYRTTRLSAIVSTDNDAYDFLRRHRDTLFPGVPVIFSGVNWFQDAQLSTLSDFTGVVESADHAATVELMLRLHPGTRRIVAILDSTTTGKALRGELEALAATLKGRVAIELWDSFDPEPSRRSRAIPSSCSCRTPVQAGAASSCTATSRNGSPRAVRCRSMRAGTSTLATASSAAI